MIKRIKEVNYMRIPKIENYHSNDNLVEYKKIKDIPKLTKQIILFNDKDKIKLIKSIEFIVRRSMEYKHYIQFLREEVDMRICSFFNNINNKDNKKISIEIHHEPFTLFDLVQIVLEKFIINEIEINPLLIAEEVMKIHYQGRVGLIPLSITVHQLIHNGKLFIPLQNVYGNFISFLEEYDNYINQDLKNILEAKLKMSREIENLDLSILEKKYIYLEVEGFTFPQQLELAA
jgi:hypothetical protein